MNRILKSNRGQSLAVFVIFVPLIIMMGTFVIDMGYAKYNKNNLNEINKTVIEYGLKHINENPKGDIINLINQNDKNIDNCDVNIDNDVITVKINKNVKGLFGSIVGKKLYKVESYYKGYIDNGKYIIERVDD